MILIFEASGEESVDVMAGISRANSGAGSKGTLTKPTSLTWADTEYMPYVGGQTRILSRPGTQKHRNKASIASSLPTPTNKFSGARVFGVCACVFRRLQSSCLRSCWWGSGYLWRPRKSIDGSFEGFKELGSPFRDKEGPYAFSFASRRMLVPSSL